MSTDFSFLYTVIGGCCRHLYLGVVSATIDTTVCLPYCRKLIQSELQQNTNGLLPRKNSWNCRKPYFLWCMQEAILVELCRVLGSQLAPDGVGYWNSVGEILAYPLHTKFLQDLQKDIRQSNPTLKQEDSTSSDCKRGGLQRLLCGLPFLVVSRIVTRLSDFVLVWCYKQQPDNKGLLRTVWVLGQLVAFGTYLVCEKARLQVVCNNKTAGQAIQCACTTGNLCRGLGWHTLKFVGASRADNATLL
eukprot:TRINITY_DN62223_c2_g1_i1.p1 TRINITY_DN62223_c2_g1~~TRINITY_DN62223_c2_g1_i1.p1  ORF type:complete len:246 (-),score=19.55 TRINITY_DN62223_c2_g1_i1:71-808(-)